MLVIVHDRGKRIEELILEGNTIPVLNKSLLPEFWRLAHAYPEHLLIWVEKRFRSQVNFSEIDKIFHHDLIMASFAVKEQFLPPTIGYIDQLPFVNPNSFTTYPSWLMSTDVGGIKAETALLFEKITNKKDSFGYVLNSIAKVGQQNSLFCYSDPGLVKEIIEKDRIGYNAAVVELFRFVYQFYKTEWLYILLFCYVRYENRFPFLSFLSAFFTKKRFKAEVDLAAINSVSTQINSSERDTVDVIIPTLKRPAYVEQVLNDLKNQSLVPAKVIIIEQDPELGSVSQLREILNENWPFKIEHRFVNRAGACKARNLALNFVSSNWIFFADDDIRVPPETLKDAVLESRRLGVNALNLNCIQPGGKTVFHKIKQWGAFGSGTSLVKAEYALQCEFNEAYEYGFGEDTDFGLQLRAIGADIVYHPKVQITHLKAGRGGFREEVQVPWEKTDLKPKPSPTMMLLVKTHYNIYMLRGYKVSLFLKFYSRQSIKNPIKYLKTMEKRWDVSQKWAQKLASEKVMSEVVE